MLDPALETTPIQPGAQPFDWRLVHADFGDGAAWCLEVRPSEGVWKPFLLGVPAGERMCVVSLLPGKPGQPPAGALVGNPRSGPTADGSYWCWQIDNAATQTQSYFAYLKELPSGIVFGQAGGGPQYRLDVREVADQQED